MGKKCTKRRDAGAELQLRQRNVQLSVIHVQSCRFGCLTYCFFDVLVAVAVVIAKAFYFLN